MDFKYDELRRLGLTNEPQELTEAERAELSRPSFRISSPGRRQPDLRGGSEAGATILSSTLASVPAGVATIGALPFGAKTAAEVGQRVQNRLTIDPKTEGGIRATMGVVNALATLGVPGEWIGDKVYGATGSPGAAVAAQMLLDPLNAAGLVMAGPALRAGARAAGRGAQRAGQAAVQNLGPKVAELAESYMRRSGMAPEITTYHGTPHTFAPEPGLPLGRFRAEKIGSGEGAQVYGHGLYLAEEPAVATGYRERLTGKNPNVFRLGDKDVSIVGGSPEWKKFSDAAESQGYSKESAALAYHTLKDKKGDLDAASGELTWMDNATKIHDDAANLLRYMQYKPEGGALYTVDLPDPMVDRMLDWNKPVKEQSQQVQKIIQQLVSQEVGQEKAAELMLRDSFTGQNAMLHLPAKSSIEDSQVLRRAGIPGIKYLDEGSRGAGEGTRNFVVFPGEEQNLRILERDGVKAENAVKKAQGGAVEGSDMSYSQTVDRIKSGLVQGGMDSGQAMEAALRMAESKMKVGGAVMMAGGGAARRTRYEGPMPNRPVVNGRAVVSTEELADFRRQFGADKTLRDLLNADRGLTRRGETPSAQDMRARGPQGPSEAPASPYSDPSRVMEGVAASQREIAAPGRDAVEPVAPELALALAPRIAQLLGVSASALRARLAAAGKDWRDMPPRGADKAKWDAIVKQIDEAYPQAAPARVETPPLGTGRSAPDLEPPVGVPQPSVRGVMERPEPAMQAGGLILGNVGRAAARSAQRASAKAAKEAAAKAAKEAEEAAAKAAKEAARTPQQRSVVAKFGQKAEQEARRSAKVRKMEEEIDAPSTPKSSAVGATRTAALPPDYFRQMAKTQGEDAVIRAAERGEHIRPVPGGYVGAPRTVTSPQGLGGMRRSMDKDFMDSVEAVRMADPERLGTWYDRAKMGIAESAEPYQLPRVLEQHGVYSAGVSPEAELGFALKHLNSRVAGQPGMAYRGAPMRTLDEAVAQNRPANMGFKIGEYMEKNDPRVPNTGLFGVNDFRRAQGMGYTDPQGNPWRAGVSDTMHPFMDAETALQVNRARTSGAGGRTDWQGPHIQELPWVYGKAQDLYGRGKEGRFAGDEVEGISRALIEANNTARDYMYKHAGSATHEAIPGASTGHVPDIIVASPEERLKYSKTGRWDRPMPEGPLSAAPTVGAGPRDVIYSALGYRQLPSIEASGAYFPAGKTTPEHQPVTIARPLMDFPTGGEEGLASKSTRDVMDFAERFRAAMDAQEAYGYNLPNTMPTVRDKNAIVLDTRARNPKKLGEPHTGLRPNEQQMADLSKLLDDAGYGIAPTSRGATIFPYDPTATTKQARDLLKDLGPKIQEIFPSNAQLSKNTMGYGPGIGIRTPEGPRASEPFSGQATMNLLSEASRLPENVALNLSESEGVRRAIMDKLNRDAPLAGARPDIQKMREFFAKEDWAKVVDLIRKGMLPAAALTSLGYSPFSMAEER